ncbi:hypothetical protein PQC06_gp188 [Aeromonas phage LAh10]|uniref:Uncharacterized protein n=1 Tax=Aeromonas phage LAh10 TaxID=2591025 RepID=A0A514A1H2_9CAUD|nr:hypothetical protein PQC06_gp188 [Aeromonas phage LAh10]QDH47120.1 hypothetical protein LAh10_187 [Aeromonas phage LAh10]
MRSPTRNPAITRRTENTMNIKDALVQLREYTYQVRHVNRQLQGEVAEFSMEELQRALDNVKEEREDILFGVGCGKRVFWWEGPVYLQLVALRAAWDNNTVGADELFQGIKLISEHPLFKEMLEHSVPFNSKKIFNAAMSRDEAAEIILHLFKNGNTNSEHHIPYFAVLQQDIPDMCRRLGLGKMDYEELWSELTFPTSMCRGDYYVNCALPVLEFMKRKQLRESIAASKDQTFTQEEL